MIPDKFCRNCSAELHGKFCSHCGQKAYDAKDKSIRKLADEAFHFITHFDGKIWKTLRVIYFRPGQLSLDYSNGIRQRYYKPISLYIFIVILYLIFPLASGMNMEMRYYKTTPLSGTWITRQIEEKISTANWEETQLEQAFHLKSKTTSKFLLLLLIPLSMPLIYLLYIRKKRYVFDNVILLAEINIFYLLTLFILVPLLFLPFSYLFGWSVNDNIFLPISITLFSVYCISLLHRVFQEKWWVSICKGTLFGLLFMFMIVTVYRTIVFEVTFTLL